VYINHSNDICSRSAVRASGTLTRSFARYTLDFTYLIKPTYFSSGCLCVCVSVLLVTFAIFLRLLSPLRRSSVSMFRSSGRSCLRSWCGRWRCFF